MKYINTGFISDPTIQQPFTGPSLDFVQEGVKELIFGLCRAIVANHGIGYVSTTPYLITGDFSPYDGYVFFQGELYRMKENVTGYPYAYLDTTPNATYDPLTFTDGIMRNVHNERYIDWQPGVTGSMFNQSDIVNVATPYDLVAPNFASYTDGAMSSSGTTIAVIFTGGTNTTNGVNYNSGTGIYQVTKTGFYEINFHYVMQIAASLSGFVASPDILVNAASVGVGGNIPYTGNNLAIEYNSSGIYSLTAGDTVKFTMNLSSPQSITFFGNHFIKLCK